MHSNNYNYRIGILDLLRVLAIVLVVLTHYYNSYVPGGSVGVSIFFCLSGYLVTKNLIVDDITKIDFIIRRFFRIYPAYLIVCILHLLLLYFSSSPNLKNYLSALPELLLFIKMPKEWLGFGVGVFWTLQIEICFYLLIPFIIKKSNLYQSMIIEIILILACYTLKYLVYYNILLIPDSSLSILKLFHFLDNLLYGSLVALLLTKRHKRSLLKQSPSQKIILKLTSICLIIFAILLIARYWISVGKLWPIQSSVVSLLTCIIIFLSQKNMVTNIKSPFIITYGSLMAYVIYLAHPFPLDYYIIYRHYFHITNFEYKIIVFSSLIILITGLHYLVEKPGIRLGKKTQNILK